LEWVHI